MSSFEENLLEEMKTAEDKTTLDIQKRREKFQELTDEFAERMASMKAHLLEEHKNWVERYEDVPSGDLSPEEVLKEKMRLLEEDFSNMQEKFEKEKQKLGKDYAKELGNLSKQVQDILDKTNQDPK